jgi:hypothetical protein
VGWVGYGLCWAWSRLLCAGLGVGGLVVGRAGFGLVVCWLYWMWAVLGMGWAGCEPGWVGLVGMWAGPGVDCIVSSCTRKVYVIVN